MIEITKDVEPYYHDALALVQNFFKEALGEYSDGISESYLLDSFNKYKKDSFFLIIDGKCEGMLAGRELDERLNGGLIYQEVMWYVNERYRKYGVKLLKEVEKAIKADGYKAIVMVCLHNSKTDKLFSFYEKMGYKKMETSFIKQF